MQDPIGENTPRKRDELAFLNADDSSKKMRTEKRSWIHQGERHCQSHMLWLISGPENLRGVSSGKNKQTKNQIESWAAYFD